MGEYNLTSERDCVSFGNDRPICADQHMDVPIGSVTVHPEYNRKTLKNDIAVIRLRYEVLESGKDIWLLNCSIFRFRLIALHPNKTVWNTSDI